MNMLFIKHFVVGFMVSEIPRVSVFGHYPTDSVRIQLLSPMCLYVYITCIMITVVIDPINIVVNFQIV